VFWAWLGFAGSLEVEPLATDSGVTSRDQSLDVGTEF